MEHLNVCPLTSKAFKAFLSQSVTPEADSRRLALLLYDVVYCKQTQKQKSDDFKKSLTGIHADNLEYAPKRIEGFCEWVKRYIDLEHRGGNTQDFENVLPELRNLAHSIRLNGKKAARWRPASSKAVYDLAIFMERKTGEKRFSDLAIFLNETARLLEMKPDYTRKSLQDTFDNYLKKRT